MSTTLPEIPSPPSYVSAYDDAPLTDHYSAGQMHAYGLAVWKAAMEGAAHELEQIANVISGPYESDGHYALLNACATTIRSLLPLPELAGSPQERRE